MPSADLVIMTLNVHATSDPEVVRKWLGPVIRGEGVDLVALQELTAGHIRALSQIAGYSLLVDRGEPGSAETGWLVSGTGNADALVRAKRMTRDGWFGWRTGRQHTPRYMAVIKQDEPHLYFGSVHTPPGVDVTVRGLTGPRDRQRAWRQYMRSLLRWADRPRFILVGDWNERPIDAPKWSPVWFARKVNAFIEPTRTIDYMIYKGVVVKDHKDVVTPKGVDHDAHIFYVDFI